MRISDWSSDVALPISKRERLNLVSRIVAFKAHPYVKHRSAADDDKPLDYFEDLAREEIDGMSNMELLDLISIVLEDENEPIDAPAFVGSVGRAMKITEAQRSLVRLLRVCDPRYIDRATVRRNGLTEDFERVRRAGLIRDRKSTRLNSSH